MPPRKKGHKKYSRGAATRVVEDAQESESEAETTGHPAASQMDILAEVN